MKVKTSELQGDALDWAVELLENGEQAKRLNYPSSYSTEWEYGGPIIEREMIELVPQSPALWEAMYKNQHIPNDGPTPLIAAMRCYVASKLGDEVEIPKGE